jgi:hypothetical protein
MDYLRDLFGLGGQVAVQLARSYGTDLRFNAIAPSFSWMSRTGCC